MALTTKDRLAYVELSLAGNAGRLALLDYVHQETGDHVAMLCIIGGKNDGEPNVVPAAILRTDYALSYRPAIETSGERPGGLVCNGPNDFTMISHEEAKRLESEGDIIAPGDAPADHPGRAIMPEARRKSRPEEMGEDIISAADLARLLSFTPNDRTH